MSLARVHVVLVRLAGVAERFHDLLGLAARNARIVLALEDEKRCADLGCVRERRALPIKLSVLRRIAKLADQIVPQISARRLRHRLPGNDPDHRDTGSEAIGPERERHQRQVATIAAAVAADQRRATRLLSAWPSRTGRGVLTT